MFYLLCLKTTIRKPANLYYFVLYQVNFNILWNFDFLLIKYKILFNQVKATLKCYLIISQLFCSFYEYLKCTGFLFMY